MKTSTEAWAFASIIRKEKVINPKPQYQRGPVWSVGQKQLLIDSILRGMDVPKLYLREIEGNGRYRYEVIDGQQRLRAIWEYCRGQYSLSDDNTEKINGKNITGLVYEDLPETLKDDLDTYQLSVVIIRDSEESEIEEMFLRLQNGTTLKAAEKRNAISGPTRDYIRDIVKHDFFQECVQFKNKRYSHDAVASQMLLLELNKGPVDIKDRNLEILYKDKSFKASSSEARDMKKTLKYLYKEFQSYTPELKRAVAVSIYLVSSDLLKNYNMKLSLSAGEFKNWFLGFEERRLKEIDKSEDEGRDSEAEAYTYSLAQGTNSRDSLERRHQYLIKDFLINYPRVELKDSSRNFSESQRLAVYRRDKGFCAIGREKVSWDNFTVDHITAYSRGGKTALENAQLLCQMHNKQKGSKV